MHKLESTKYGHTPKLSCLDMSQSRQPLCLNQHLAYSRYSVSAEEKGREGRKWRERKKAKLDLSSIWIQCSELYITIFPLLFLNSKYWFLFSNTSALTSSDVMQVLASRGSCPIVFSHPRSCICIYSPHFEFGPFSCPSRASTFFLPTLFQRPIMKNRRFYEFGGNGRKTDLQEAD